MYVLQTIVLVMLIMGTVGSRSPNAHSVKQLAAEAAQLKLAPRIQGDQTPGLPSRPGNDRGAPAWVPGPPSLVAPGPDVVGRWSPVYAWPDVATHLVLLRNRKILTFADDDNPDWALNGSRLADFSKAFIVDIPNGKPPGVVTKVFNNTTNMFCSAHTLLPDGRAIVLGGHEGQDGVGSADVNILPYTGGWQTRTTTPMNGGRWYPSAVTLANGEIVVLGGTNNGFADPNMIPEVWRTNNGGGWRQLSTAPLSVPLYSPIYLAPNGKVYMPGIDQFTRYLNTAGTGLWESGPRRLFGWRDYGSSAIFDDGRILAAGGGDPPTSSAEIINLRTPAPAWQWTGSMQHARRQMNLTILADGKVLATGGTSSPGFNDASDAQLAAEIWAPATGRWTTMASMQVPRLYHASALLLPDARVLSTGGGRPAATNGGTDNENAEIYSPPYLFKGARPTIGTAPTSVRYGATFSVTTPNVASIARVTWVRLSSVTHTVNMNQRFNNLRFSKVAGGLAVVAPSNRNLTPPGHYMLFILNGGGVPSVSRIVQIT